MTEKPRNAMQAVLDLAVQKETAESPQPLPPLPLLSKTRRTARASAPQMEEKSFGLPSRRNICRSRNR